MTALPITKRVKLINKKKFVAAALDKKVEIFIVHMTVLLTLSIHPSRKTQIRVLIAKKAPTKLPAEYLDYADVFLPDLVIELLEYIGINNYTIDFVEDKQLPYGSIYRLGLVKLRTLKNYIKTYLKTWLICPFKSSAGTPIFFN